MYNIQFWPLDHSNWIKPVVHRCHTVRGESIECEELPLLLTSCFQRFGSTGLGSSALASSATNLVGVLAVQQHAFPGDQLPATGMPSRLLQFSLLVPWLLGRRPPSVCPIDAPCLWAAREIAIYVICGRNKPPVCVLARYMCSSLYSILRFTVTLNNAVLFS